MIDGIAACIMLGQVFVAPCWDVNPSRVINIIDVLMTAQYYAGLNPMNFDSAAADVSGDGMINIVDGKHTAVRLALISIQAGMSPVQPRPTGMILRICLPLPNSTRFISLPPLSLLTIFSTYLI